MSKQGKSWNSIVLLIVATFFILFLGLRWEIGTDWNSYKELFDTLELDWNFVVNVYRFEFGYVLLNYFTKLIYSDYTFFLIIDASIAIIPLFLVIRKTSPYVGLSCFLFYSIYFLPHFMGSNRRMIAISFVLLGFSYLYENKKKKYYLSILFAILFHKSSIIALLALFLYKRNIEIKKIILVLFLSLIIGLLDIPSFILNALFSFIPSNSILDSLLFYSDSVEEVSIAQILSAIARRCIFISMYLYVIYRNKNVDRMSIYFLYLYFTGFIIYCLFLQYQILQVSTTYFAIVEILLFPRMLSYLKYEEKYLVLFFLLIYCFVQLLSGLSVYPEEYNPYKSIL